MYQFHNQKRNESSFKNKEKPIHLKNKAGWGGGSCLFSHAQMGI